MKKLQYNGPIVLVIMDGVGLSVRRSGNAVRQAHTEFLDYAMSNYLNIPLQASGTAVGIMPGQMGNSEVGHNAIGSGQIIKQGIADIEAAFQTGDVWESRAWRGAMKQLGAAAGLGSHDAALSSATRDATSGPAPRDAAQHQSAAASKPAPTLHFSGIFSDGGVHSDLKYLEQMITRAHEEGVKKIRIHAIFDGRDVAPQSEPKYIERIETFLKTFPKDTDYRIASGGGRMVMVADRYGNDWDMVKLGWQAIVHGKAPRSFTSATAAVKTLRREQAGLQDQYLPAFVIVDAEERPVGKVSDGDAFIYFDFRADRAVEFATAFTAKNFDKFDRSARGAKKFDPAANPLPAVYFAGLTEYDADRHIPKNVLVPPRKITDPLNLYLGQNHISQLAISETAKFGHITYYFNGNSYKKAPHETFIEIPSDTEPFDTRPWMKSAEITDTVLANLSKYQFVRINYPNGDMVGHFAELEPTIVAVEAVDLQLARLARKVDELGGMMIITADHGNAEELIDSTGTPKTAHTTNLVPCIFYDNTSNAGRYRSAKLPDAGLSNLAATITCLLGLPYYPAIWRKPLIRP